MAEGALEAPQAAPDPASKEAVQVLLVDDEELFTLTLADILEDHGYSVLTATDGVTALALSHRHHPALIFLDLRMPGMSGEEVCRRVRSQPTPPTVVIITATADEEQTARLLQFGARAVLSKPVSINHLLEIVAGVCGLPIRSESPREEKASVPENCLGLLQPAGIPA